MSRRPDEHMAYPSPQVFSGPTEQSRPLSIQEPLSTPIPMSMPPPRIIPMPMHNSLPNMIPQLPLHFLENPVNPGVFALRAPVVVERNHAMPQPLDFSLNTSYPGAFPGPNPSQELYHPSDRIMHTVNYQELEAAHQISLASTREEVLPLISGAQHETWLPPTCHPRPVLSEGNHLHANLEQPLPIESACTTESPQTETPKEESPIHPTVPASENQRLFSPWEQILLEAVYERNKNVTIDQLIRLSPVLLATEEKLISWFSLRAKIEQGSTHQPTAEEAGPSCSRENTDGQIQENRVGHTFKRKQILTPKPGPSEPKQPRIDDSDPVYSTSSTDSDE